MEAGLSKKELLILVLLVVFLFIPAGLIAIDSIYKGFLEGIK